MGWETRFQNNDPSYLEPRISNAESSLAEIATNVKSYGAVGDGVHDDTTAVQNAINGAGQGGKLYFPPGKYLITNTLVLPYQITLEGYGFYFGSGSNPTIPQSQLVFNMASGNGIEVGNLSYVNGIFKNLFIYNKSSGNTAIGIHNTNISHPHFDKCTFIGWGTAVSLNQSYYPKFNDCDFAYCTTALSLTGCYNVNLYACAFRVCNTSINVVDYVRPLSIYGGSIEGYTVNGISANSGSTISLFGVYTEITTQAPNINFIKTTGDCDINLYGNVIYINEMYACVNAAGTSNTTINSKGNKFLSASTSSTTPVAYLLPTSGEVNIEGDDWTAVQKGTYMDGTFNQGAVLNYNVKAPKGISTFHKDYNFQGRSNVYPKLTAAPSTPFYGAIFLADGVTWNPLNKPIGKPYFVQYLGAGAYGNLEMGRSGKATITGDGTTTQFSITHGLGDTPNYCQAVAGNVNAAASGINYVSADSTNLYVVFKNAPANGVSQIVYWKVEF